MRDTSQEYLQNECDENGYLLDVGGCLSTKWTTHPSTSKRRSQCFTIIEKNK